MQKPRNIVGPVVRQLREKMGLTQPQLVARLNLAGWDVSRETLAKIEAQIRWVADFEILKLAAGIGIDATELLRLAASKRQKQPPS
jgi:transcriptional regulator with XRE-family HTH domain